MKPSLVGLEAWARASVEHVSGVDIAIGVLLFVATLGGSAAAAVIVLRRLPADYLRRDRAVEAQQKPSSVRLVRAIGKNLLGVLLVALGIVLSIPGVPGQGLLTIVLGVMLLDFPGKVALERKLMGRPSVLASINKVRSRFGREPLLPPDGGMASPPLSP